MSMVIAAAASCPCSVLNFFLGTFTATLAPPKAPQSSFGQAERQYLPSQTRPNPPRRLFWQLFLCQVARAQDLILQGEIRRGHQPMLLATQL